MNLAPGTSNLIVFCGTASALALYCEDSEGVPTDLSGGWTAHAQVRRRRGSSVPIVTLTAEVTDGPTGEITLSLTEAQSAALVPDKYRWDLLLKSPGGEVTGPYLEGSFEVLKPYTDSPA